MQQHAEIEWLNNVIDDLQAGRSPRGRAAGRVTGKQVSLIAAASQLSALRSAAAEPGDEFVSLLRARVLAEASGGN